MIEFDAIEHRAHFKAIVDDFERMLLEFNPVSNCVAIQDYFGEGTGLKGSIKMLCEAGKLAVPADFKGVYVILEGRTPIYTGISRKVLTRIHQHVKGKSHHSASLAHNIAKAAALKAGTAAHEVRRNTFDFKHVERAQQFLLNQNVAFYEIEDDIALYLFEVYCAMELKTLFMNSFRTH